MFVIFNIFLLIFPQIILGAARDGLMLWFNNVLPSLLPFMVATNMLISLGVAATISNLAAPLMRRVFNLPGAAGFALFMGLTSGYPVGAKTVADLRNAKQISVQEAQHLLAFCNNAGPLFMVGAVGVGMFNSAAVGYVLWASHVVGALVVGLLYRKGASPRSYDCSAVAPHKKSVPIGKALGDAVKSSMEAITIIGGLIIFFSVVVAILEILGVNTDFMAGGIAAGLVEVAGGVRKIAVHQPSLPTIASAAFVIAFGGISIHAQTLYFTAGLGINNRKYIFAKFLHGVISAGVGVLLAVFVLK